MGFMELFMPETAEAQHLRDISRTMQQERERRIYRDADKDRGQRRLERRIDALEEENAVLGLLLVSLMKRLAEKDVVNMKEVVDQLAEIDRLDGVQDGKLSMETLQLMLGLAVAKADDAGSPTDSWICDACDHRNVPDRHRCLYCGATH